MNTGLKDDEWDELLTRISEGEVVPLVGPCAVTFGGGDEIVLFEGMSIKP